MNKIIAIPSLDDKGLESFMSSHFGHCEAYTLVRLENNDIKEVGILSNVEHQHGGCLAPVQHLKDNKVDVLIAKGMGKRPFMHFKEMNIDVFYSNGFDKINDVVSAYLDNKLSKFSDNNTCQGH